MRRLERRSSNLTVGVPPLQGDSGATGDTGDTGTTGPSGASILPRSTTAALEAIANAINTADKSIGKAIINETTGDIVTAAGPLAGDVWEALDGTTAHTPV